MRVKPVYKIENGAGRNGSRGLAFANSDPTFYRFPSQKLDLQPGRSYNFSVWVKTSGLKGEENGATVCIQWSDKNGKFLGGAYPHGIKGDHDWFQIEGFAKIPTDAASVSISPYVRKGLTGRAWFDDLSVSRYIPPPVVGICSSYYRDTVADGRVQYCVDLNLQDSGLQKNEVKGLFAVRNSSGKTLLERKRLTILKTTLQALN